MDGQDSSGVSIDFDVSHKQRPLGSLIVFDGIANVFWNFLLPLEATFLVFLAGVKMLETALHSRLAGLLVLLVVLFSVLAISNAILSLLSAFTVDEYMFDAISLGL